MSIRHCLTIEKEDKIIFFSQPLGNNEYFDEEFYKSIGVEFDDDHILEKQEVSIFKLIVAWHKWFERHSKKLGVGLKSELDVTDAQIFNNYYFGSYYQLQPYFFMRNIGKYLDIRTKELKEGYKAYLEIY